MTREDWKLIDKTELTAVVLGVALILVGVASLPRYEKVPTIITEIHTLTPPVVPAYTTHAVKVTGYCLSKKCTSYKHGLTKSGIPARVGICAADWRVYPRGTFFNIPGYGPCVVEDTGRLVKGQHLDVFFNTEEEATKWGSQILTVAKLN